MSSHVTHEREAIIQANGIEIACETFGEASDPAILLIAGLGMQFIGWDDNFCLKLAAHDYWVIRYDNRDVGHSTRFEGVRAPGIPEVALAMADGRDPSVPYSLREMADDAAGLLTALGVASAHVVGISMGGMVAQLLAVHHPHAVRSLTLLMSTTGGRDLPVPTPEAVALLLQPPPREREAYLDHAVETARILGGDPQLFEESWIRQRAADAFDRAFYPSGVARQFAAIVASGSRRPLLEQIRAPTLVLHGAVDPLVPVEAGRDLAAHIPGAELQIIRELGHELPPASWPEVLRFIVNHAVHADAAMVT